MIWLSLIGFFISAIAAGGVVRWARGHAQHYGEAMPQRFHLGHVPRLGGFSEFFWNNVLFLSRYVTEGNTETFHLLFSPKRIL